MANTYTLIVNRVVSGKGLQFNYGNTRNIELNVIDGSVCVSAKIYKKYCADMFENSYLEKLFKEAVKRSALVHILKYSRPLKINNMYIKKNEEILVEHLEQKWELFSLIDSALERKVPIEWNDIDVLGSLLNQYKSKYDSKVSAVFAYIYSKAKTNETERFIYNWMAMNGMISSLKDSKGRECDQIKFFIKKMDWGSEFPEQKAGKSDRLVYDRDTRGKMISLYVNGMLIDDVHASRFEGDDYSELISVIKEAISKEEGDSCDLSPYGFIVTDFAYYLRCTLFHANKPLPLFNFSSDMEIKSLAFVNRLLEEFIDNNLYRWFNGEIEVK